jgi:hypothetical protein
VSDYLDREPDMYEIDGAAVAVIDQQRAEAADAARTAPAIAVTWFDAAGAGTHWAIAPEDGGVEFLLYVAARSVRDLAALHGCDEVEAARLTLMAIAKGIAP